MKKKIIIFLLVLFILLGIYMLYNTFAVSSIASNISDNVYNIIAGKGTTITVGKNSSKTIYFHIKNTNKGAIKYAVGYNTGTIIEVKIYNDSKDKEEDIISYGDNKYIKLYLNNSTDSDSTVTISSVLGYENGGDLIIPNGITLVTEVHTPQIAEPTVVLSDYITNLYTEATKTTVTNNSITYNYATSVSLMNDRLGGTTSSLDEGNIRYYGASPNNYIYFNCSDYSNQTSSTCELWRIIGVFDGKVKIIRNSIIGSYSWDTTEANGYVSYGINEWSNADLMKLLNPGYESEPVGGSLYYNSGSGTCYNGEYKATTSCDFTSTGLKNDTTRGMIEEVSWNTGGWNTASVYSNQIYGYERGTTVYSKHSKTWTGKVALAYPSDYGYAADFNSCSETLDNYDNTGIGTYDNPGTITNWLYSIFSSDYNWLLTPNSGYYSDTWNVSIMGFVRQGPTYGIYEAYGVAPTIFLSNTQALYEDNADGSSTNPYKLSVN